MAKAGKGTTRSMRKEIRMLQRLEGEAKKSNKRGKESSRYYLVT
jgi:hypothetical protein